MRWVKQEQAVNSEPPLVAHIIYRLGIGGMENGIVNLINHMPVDRYRHAIICLSGHTEFADRIHREGVAIYDLQKKEGKDPACYLRLYRLLKKLSPQIVHTRNIGTLDCQFVAILAGVRCRIHGEHGWDVGDLHGLGRRYVMLRRLSRLVVHHYMTVSRHMKDWLQNVIGIPAGRVTQIYNGIDSARFRSTRSAERDSGVDSDTTHYVVGTVGRLDPIKDHACLIRAFGLLVKQSPASSTEPRLVIVGAGEMEGELVRIVAENKLEKYVTLTGASDEIPALLTSFDVFVLPSLNEGISNTVLEAMASGLAVIASDVGGNPELVSDNVTGKLFSPGDIEGLFEMLCFYRDHRDTRKRHGNAGRARAVQEFSMSAMVSNYIGLYDGGLAGTRGRGRANG